MAKITEVPAAPVPPPPAYMVELSQEEIQGLARLIRTGVCRAAIQSLKLDSLSEQLHKVLNGYADRYPNGRFNQIAEL